LRVNTSVQKTSVYARWVIRARWHSGVDHARADWRDPRYQAFALMRLAFTVAPIAFGLDKFWLGGIIVNLLTHSGFYDIALRDFGLMLAALTLARLASVYDAPLRLRRR
jgi:hypothetical protein